MSKTEASRGGIGLGMLLFLIFMILKLTGYIAWSWWWVTAPLWIPWVLIIGFMILGLGIALFTLLFVFVFGGK